MLNTQVRPARDLRNNYADIVKTLENNNHVIITNNGVGESVLIHIKDYARYEEFLHHRYVYEELQKSKSLAKHPNANMIDAADVFKRINAKLQSKGL